MPRSYFAGIDCGTSGMRAVLIDGGGEIVFEDKRSMSQPKHNHDGSITQSPLEWATCFDSLISSLPMPKQIEAIAIDGTSGTILMADEEGRPLSPGHMYNDPSSKALAERIASLAPATSAAHGATSPAARLKDLQKRYPNAHAMLHQADWLASRLTGQFLSDDNNALKTGWDPVQRRWPDWLFEFGIDRSLLPEVVQPGALMGEVRSGPLKGKRVIAGTTDGCASFLATGADSPGDGVSALGSTMTLKFLASEPVFAPEFGIYSHRIGERWLAGGASNSGGDALARFFKPAEIENHSSHIDPSRIIDHGWHPLPATGERFPIRDPDMTFEPNDRPGSDKDFLQALLEGIASVEAKAYLKLSELGRTQLRSVRSVGTGASNKAWTAIRARHLNVGMPEPLSLHAAYGTARLAAGMA